MDGGDRMCTDVPFNTDTVEETTHTTYYEWILMRMPAVAEHSHRHQTIIHTQLAQRSLPEENCTEATGERSGIDMQSEDRQRGRGKAKSQRPLKRHRGGSRSAARRGDELNLRSL